MQIDLRACALNCAPASADPINGMIPQSIRLRSSVVCLFLILSGVLLTGCRSTSITRSTAHFPAGRGFVSREVPVDGRITRLWLFIPHDYDGTKPYPAIVFLHGLFEAGSGGSGALSAGLGPAIAREPGEWEFIVLFPQSTGTWRGVHRERMVMQSLEWARRNYSIDSQRVILAGLSYGGLGTWQIGARYPDRFAALVTVSALHDPKAVPQLIHTPIWAFHSRGDLVVSSSKSARMCQQIQDLGGDARFTEFNGIDHDCWDQALQQTELLDWMHRQRRETTVAAWGE